MMGDKEILTAVVHWKAPYAFASPKWGLGPSSFLCSPGH